MRKYEKKGENKYVANLINDPNVHYVKFMRGSITAWETLQTTPEKISNDTLYFIYQNAETSTEGKLYLGQKLISGVGNGGNVSGDISINDLENVYIDDESLADKQILVYNDTTERWENTSLSTIIDTAVGIMQGATPTVAGVSGLVPVPKAGDQGKFLRGDGAWSVINIPTFNTDIFSLDSDQQYILNGYNLAPQGSIPIKTSNGIEWSSSVVGTLDYQITTMEKIQAQISGLDPEPIRPEVIYLIDNGNDPSSGNKYDEYIVVNNHLEQIGTFGNVNLTEYVKITTFNTEVSKLNDVLYDKTDSQTGNTIPGLVSRVAYLETNCVTKAEIGNLNDLLLTAGNENLVQEVNTINSNLTSLTERMKWQELNERNT